MGTLNLQRSARDIRFTVPAAYGGGTLSCMVARGKGKDGRQFRIRRVAVPAEEGRSQRLRETAVTYSSWVRGAGIGKAEDDTRGGYHYGTFLWARDRNKLMPAGEVVDLTSYLPSGTVGLLGAADYSGYTYIGAGNRRVLRVENSSTSPIVTDAGVNMNAGASSGPCIVFGANLWVAAQGSDRIWKFDGTTWSQASTDVRRSRFAVVNWVLGANTAITSSQIGSSQRVLIGTDTTSPIIYHVTDDPGDTAAWSAGNTVGDSVYPIQTLHAAGEAAYVGKPDGVFMVEGGGRMRNLAPHWRQQYDASNGAAVQYYDERLLAGHTQFLDMLSPDPNQIGLQYPCGPTALQGYENGPVLGRVSTMTTDSGYVLAAFYDLDSDHSYILAGKRADRIGLNHAAPMVWYGSEFDCDGRIDMLHVLPSVDGGPRWLLIGVLDGSTPKFYAQSLPREASPYTSWKRGGSHRFSTAFTCVLSTDDLGDPASPKNMRYVATVTENAANTRALTVSTSTDGGASVEQVVVNEAGRQFAVMDTATAAGVNVAVTLTGASEPTEPLVVRSVKLRGTINDERTVVYQVPLVIGRDLDTNRGTKDPSSPFVKLTQLYSLLEAGPITAVDWHGVTRTMVVDDIEDDEILDDDGVGVTIYATITLSVLLSTALYGQAVYGSARYG